MFSRSSSGAAPAAPPPVHARQRAAGPGRPTDGPRGAVPRRGMPMRRSLSRDLWRNVDELPTSGMVDRMIARETARADRTGQPFSIALFRVSEDQAGDATESAPPARGVVALADRRLALTLLRRARLTDEVGWFSGEYLCALLPDTSARGALTFADSVCDLVGRKDERPAAIVYTYPYEGIEGPSEVDEELEAEPRAGHPSHANGNGNGHERLNENGRKNGNGHKHVNGNGNGHAVELAVGRAAAVSLPEDVLRPANGQTRSAELERVWPSSEGAARAVEAPATRAAVEPLATLLEQPMPWWKRTIDLIGAGVGLLLISPLLLGVAAAIKLTCPGGPVLFTQRRAGLGGRPFTIYKFRTMCVDAEAKKNDLMPLNEQDGPAFKMEHDPRVTRLGRFLRKTSIDELPQLINVLKGDMSLVGPRPLPIDESAACERWQKQRLDVTPGLTCIWQVAGRNQVTFSEWVRMDVAYMRRRTVLHDLSILIRTIPAVLLRRGAK